MVEYSYMNSLYFLWDYDLTEKDIRRILSSGNETEKIWMMSRILSCARFEDVWKYLKVKEVAGSFSKLRLRPEIKNAWKTAFLTWGYNV